MFDITSFLEVFRVYALNVLVKLYKRLAVLQKQDSPFRSSAARLTSLPLLSSSASLILHTFWPETCTLLLISSFPSSIQVFRPLWGTPSYVATPHKDVFQLIPKLPDHWGIGERWQFGFSYVKHVDIERTHIQPPWIACCQGCKQKTDSLYIRRILAWFEKW